MKSKHLSISILSLLLSLSLYAQYDTWTDATIITDSSSINSNVVMYNNNYSAWIFYEKQIDSSSPSMIYAQNVDDLGLEVALLSHDSFSYKYPQITYSSQGNESIRLIFTSDENGPFNIYAIDLELSNLSLGDQYQLTTASTDVRNPQVGSHRIGWEMGGCIYGASLELDGDSSFLEHQTLIDDNSHESMKMHSEKLYWQRNVNDSLHLYFSQRNYIPDSMASYWSAPIAFDTSHNTIYFSGSPKQDFFGFSYIFQMHGDSIFANDTWSGNEGFVYANSFESPMAYLTHICWDVLVYSSELYNPAFIGFTAGEQDYREVYALTNEWGEISDTVNLSLNNVADINPQFFWGDPVPNQYNNWFVYCIWQSKRNGSWPLYMAKNIAFIGSSTAENGFLSNINMRPNPFYQSLSIDITTHEDAPLSISIYSLTGQLVYQGHSSNHGLSDQQFTWEPDQSLAKGTYLIVIQQNKNTYSQKVIFR